MLRGIITTLILLQPFVNMHTDAHTHSILERYVYNIAYFNRFYPQEKVYIHMDNRSYFLGDTIWFKAYVVEANTHELTTMSKILYVELLNESGVLLECKKLQVENGMCHGEFALDEEYRTGYYELRAYTRYMLNFGNNSDVIRRGDLEVAMEGSVSSEGGGSGGGGGDSRYNKKRCARLCAPLFIIMGCSSTSREV